MGFRIDIQSQRVFSKNCLSIKRLFVLCCTPFYGKSCLFQCFRDVPVVDTGLGLSVPQTDLHASRNVNGETSLKLRTCLQTRLELDDLKDSK